MKKALGPQIFEHQQTINRLGEEVCEVRGEVIFLWDELEFHQRNEHVLRLKFSYYKQCKETILIQSIEHKNWKNSVNEKSSAHT